MDGIQYVNSTIDFIQTEAGKAQNNGGTYTYIYHLTDHLGNVRYVFDIYGGAVRRLQEDDYYPFGLRKPAGSPVSLDNKYLYNGKELQYELEQYDYGARFFDPITGRFSTIDPVAEHFPWMTSYQYASNDTIKNIDLDGLEGIPINFLLGNNSAVPKVGNFVETASKYTSENIGKAGGDFKPGALEAFRRGNAAEAEQLAKNGLEKNTKPIEAVDPKTGQKGTTVPDALSGGGKTSEIKNVSRQSLTRQLRIQEKYSNDNGFNPELIINKGAKLSEPLKKSSFEIKTYQEIITVPSDNTKVVSPEIKPATKQVPSQSSKQAQEWDAIIREMTKT
ncbi:RHS repeat-associated core domain-containing protein [Pedobacter sp. KR3-3]|uniref:RHS repeat-associated core domain-containing protein n=1 Tax=Pedobacter albus TaxID=3113905 RepID=A0ABU7IAC8_9SPHI|nr:RHS repeat-associated core domain-containing protein [Pedobacter sp. KR3-3]MEE1946442.1 RHS repeat-associated core domain-containing protein [Pedobacter sp. KR3-3]